MNSPWNQPLLSTDKECEGSRTPLRCRNRVPLGTTYCVDCGMLSEEILRYRDLRDEGYSQYEAGVKSGLMDPDEAKE